MENQLELYYEFLYDQQYEVGVKLLNMQKKFAEHTHDYIEIVCQIEGESEHIINNKLFQVKQEQILIIGVGNTHRNLESNYPSLILLLSEKYLNNIVIESAFDPSVIAIQQFFSSNTPIIINSSKNMTEILKQIYLNKKDGCTAYYIKQRMLLTQYILELGDNENIKHYDSIDNTDLITYIFNNLQNASLNEYANIIHYAPVTAGNKIKIKFGLTFTQIVKQIRIKKAADLLSEGELPIEKIMDIIGYNNKTHFYKCFSDIYNMSPAKYRSHFKTKK